MKKRLSHSEAKLVAELAEGLEMPQAEPDEVINVAFSDIGRLSALERLKKRVFPLDLMNRIYRLFKDKDHPGYLHFTSITASYFGW